MLTNFNIDLKSATTANFTVKMLFNPLELFFTTKKVIVFNLPNFNSNSKLVLSQLQMGFVISL